MFLVSKALGIKPKRGESAQALSCTDCGAEPGHRCHANHGSTHAARLKAFDRAQLLNAATIDPMAALILQLRASFARYSEAR